MKLRFQLSHLVTRLRQTDNFVIDKRNCQRKLCLVMKLLYGFRKTLLYIHPSRRLSLSRVGAKVPLPYSLVCRKRIPLALLCSGNQRNRYYFFWWVKLESLDSRLAKPPIGRFVLSSHVLPGLLRSAQNLLRSDKTLSVL